MEKLSTRSPSYKIQKANFPRFEIKEKKIKAMRLMPGPQSYNKHQVIDNLKSRTKLGSFSKATHASYFADKVKRSFSPGPGAYENVEQA